MNYFDALDIRWNYNNLLVHTQFLKHANILNSFVYTYAQELNKKCKIFHLVYFAVY